MTAQKKTCNKKVGVERFFFKKHNYGIRFETGLKDYTIDSSLDVFEGGVKSLMKMAVTKIIISKRFKLYCRRENYNKF